MRRLFALGLSIALVLGIAACDTTPPRYSALDLDDADLIETSAPDRWSVVPGQPSPRFVTVGVRPAGAIAFQIQLESGEEWVDAFGSPMTFQEVEGGYTYGHSPLRGHDFSEVDEVRFRARWVYAGPEVSPWSEILVVKSAASIPGVCHTAMERAAGVPLAEDNNAEVKSALDACATLENWITALYLYPQALGYNFGKLDEIDPVPTTEMVCALVHSPRACRKPDLGIYSLS